jgi:integrase
MRRPDEAYASTGDDRQVLSADEGLAAALSRLETIVDRSGAVIVPLFSSGDRTARSASRLRWHRTDPQCRSSDMVLRDGVTNPPRPTREQRRRMLPRPTTKKKRYLTADEIDVLARTEPLAPRYSALVLLGAFGALRWGELAGLRIHSLRLLERKVEVVETDQGTEPKWGSAGTITIPRSISGELACHIDTSESMPRDTSSRHPRGGRWRTRTSTDAPGYRPSARLASNPSHRTV